MRKILVPASCALALSAAIALGNLQSIRPGAAPVTFSEHIAPIVFNNCTTCHHTGEAVPFTLMNYDEVRQRGRTIVAVTASRYMPPWRAATEMGHFRDERRLSDDQIQLIRAWVDTGMAPGDLTKLPALPNTTTGWSLGPPDLVVKMDRVFEVPADGPDLFRNFAIPLGLKEDKWVKAIDFHPSGRSSHHALFFLDPTGEAVKLQAQQPTPGFTGMAWLADAAGRGLQGILGRTNSRGQAVGAGSTTAAGTPGAGGIGGWAVGGRPHPLPEGLARPLAAGSDLVLQMHFHPTGKVEREQATIGFYFASAPPKRTLSGLQLPPLFGRFAGIDLPAGARNVSIRDSFTLPVDVDVIAMGGHAHYLATRMTMKATLPGNAPRILASVPDWDFNWQERYFYREPVRLPKGTRLDVEILYDNSVDNPHNPRNPPQRVRWGQQSLDEMGSLTLELVPARESDLPVFQNAVRQHTVDAILSSATNLAPAGAGRTGRGAVAGGAAQPGPLIQLFDRDGDGKLDPAELDEALKALQQLSSQRGR